MSRYLHFVRSILSAATVCLASPALAQETVHIKWPLVDFVVRGDTNGIAQILAAPNLASVQGSQDSNSIGWITLEPSIMLQWATRTRQLVDSLSDVHASASGFIGSVLTSPNGRGFLAIAADPRENGTHFTTSFNDSISGEWWQVAASRKELDRLFGALVRVAAWITHPDSAPVHAANNAGLRTCPVPLSLGRSHSGVTPPHRVSSGGVVYPVGATPREGRVWVQFVVDATGAVDTASFCVLLSDHEYFTTAVRRALSSFRFVPAHQGEKPVNAMIFQEFRFIVRPRSSVPPN